MGVLLPAQLMLAAAAVACAATPEERALAYLAREVPAWSRENHCFSCHNNWDGARARHQAGPDRAPTKSS